MEPLLLVFLVLAFAVQNRGYNNEQTNTKINKGHIGKTYEGILYEAANIQMPKEVFIEQRQNQARIRKAAPTYLFPNAQPVINSNQNNGFNETFWQPFNIQQQHFNINSNQYNDAATVHNAQQHYNQFADNTNYQQYQQQLVQHQQQAGIYSQTAPPTQQQQQYPSQPYRYDYSDQSSPCSRNLQNDLVNNRHYVSQSEASQLDMPYKQIDGNPRPFTRIISKCDVSGQCEPQNAADCGGNGGSDFHHQQVLKLSRAQIQPIADKFENKFNQFTGNALTSNAAKEQRGIPIRKGTDIKDRRLFPYSEVVIPQYPHS